MEPGTTNNKLYWSVKNQELISVLCCILMIAGLLFARALLSIGMILLFLNALHPQKIKENWATFKRSKFAILCMVFFAAYCLSGLWSEDKESWFSTIQIKLPFIFIPFAMGDLHLEKGKRFKIIITALLILLLAGMSYGFSFIITHPSQFASGSHLPSPLEGDYIRFTIALVLALLLIIFLYNNRSRYVLSKTHVGLLLSWSIIAIAYIHIQAAKSGLVGFYILLGIFLLYNLIRKRQYLFVAAGLFAIIIAALMLSQLPSVQKQIQGFEYEKKVWETNDTAAFNLSSSFVPRIISYEIAGHIIMHHPLGGVGAGDIMKEIRAGYNDKYPNIREVARILPHNQFICTALATGIPMGCFLLFLVLFPIMKREYRNIYAVTNTIIMLFGMMIEPMLEVQYGVFVYLFFTLLWMEVSVKETTVIKRSGLGEPVPFA